MRIWAGKFGQRNLAVLAATLVLPAAASAAVVHSVSAEADAYVRSSAERKSYGFEYQLDLRMGAGVGASEGYVRFPLPQHARYADKVVLRIFAQLADPGAIKTLVRSVVPSEWSELNLNWQTRPEHKDTLGAISVVGLSGAWYEVDVTAAAKAEATSGAASLTLALVPGEESKNRTIFHSRENAQKKPELVFSRQPVSMKISFLPARISPPAGYRADNGEAFGPRPGGLLYGWSMDNREFVRDRSDVRYKHDKNPPIKTPDRRYDFVAYMDNEKMKSPSFWEMGLPDGGYRVRVVAGDSYKYDSIFGITVEGRTVVSGVPDASRRWIEGSATVEVKDGRLTIGNSPDASNNKLCFVEVAEIETLLTKNP